jgi:hypothetical protein
VCQRGGDLVSKPFHAHPEHRAVFFRFLPVNKRVTRFVLQGLSHFRNGRILVAVNNYHQPGGNAENSDFERILAAIAGLSFGSYAAVPMNSQHGHPCNDNERYHQIPHRKNPRGASSGFVHRAAK